MLPGGEPVIKVGLMSEPELKIELQGEFIVENGTRLPAGNYTARRIDAGVKVEGPVTFQAGSEENPGVRISPADFNLGRLVVHGITIGIDFHWQRRESQTFQGSLTIKPNKQGVLAINELPLELYLVSVISSEMSASSPAELLKAHSIISRSWLLAQLQPGKPSRGERPIGDSGQPPEPPGGSTKEAGEPPEEIIRWYSREAHADFDVCSDDHCQRYQGVGKAFSPAAFDAVKATRGVVLALGEEVCDARYSKCCGGVTERYSAAWDDRPVEYLSSIYDGDPDALNDAAAYNFPLTIEANAERWITSAPPAFCNVGSKSVLSRILPGFDQETLDFYRWTVTYGSAELGEIVRDRLGVELGAILDLVPLERGESGRIVRLRIVGAKRTVVIGKELEIRRALSRSHLYSSAFVVRKQLAIDDGGLAGIQTSDQSVFTLTGAGWGHGVGLCQIGAGMMAELGYDHTQILAHYFRGSELRSIYN